MSHDAWIHTRKATSNSLLAHWRISFPPKMIVVCSLEAVCRLSEICFAKCLLCLLLKVSSDIGLHIIVFCMYGHALLCIWMSNNVIIYLNTWHEPKSLELTMYIACFWPHLQFYIATCIALYWLLLVNVLRHFYSCLCSLCAICTHALLLKSPRPPSPPSPLPTMVQIDRPT